jgi:hypothetical protein
MPFFSENYLTLLNQFSSSKTNFIQFLEELMVNSYLCLHYKEAQNKFNLVIDTTNINRPYKDKIDYFKEIYEKTKEFIIDIIFNDNAYKNNIINEVITIVLCLCNGLNDINELNDENLKIRNILFDLLKELLKNIIEIYSRKIKDNNKKIMKRHSLKDVTKAKNNDNMINEKKDEINSKHEKLVQNYAIITSFIFEYILLMENSNVFISKILTDNSDDLVKIKNFAGIPGFLKYEINKKKEKKSKPSKIDIYLKMLDDIMESFNIENLLKIIINKKDKEKRKTIDINTNESLIFSFEPSEIKKLFKDYSNKDLKNAIKEKINLLLLSYNEEFKNLPLITIITILNNYYIDSFINSGGNETISLESE